MKIFELRAALERAGVTPASFALTPDDPTPFDGLVLREHGSWYIEHMERGTRTLLAVCGTEEEACLRLLALLAPTASPPLNCEAETSPSGVEWFHGYLARLRHSSVREEPAGGPYRCPCCRKRTLDERGGFEICSVCFWEDDGQDDADADEVRGGPNGRLSLTQARENYARLGACEEAMVKNVRKPKPEEE